jgi:hypothetical protein
MRRVLLVLVLLGCDRKHPEQKPVVAPLAKAKAPKRIAPSLPTAQFTLSYAETANTPAAWSAVADAYAQDLSHCTSDCRDVAYQVVLARKQAVKAANLPKPEGDEWAPLPVPAEVQAAIEATDAFVAMLDPTDDDVAGMQFLSASSLWRYRQDEALPRLEALLREHRDDATAEYAANQLLDALMRAGKLAELRAWATELAADETFLANKPELRATLERVVALLASTN